MRGITYINKKGEKKFVQSNDLALVTRKVRELIFDETIETITVFRVAEEEKEEN